MARFMPTDPLVGNRVLEEIENPYSLVNLRKLDAWYLQYMIDDNSQYTVYHKWVYDPVQTNNDETNFEVYDALTHNKSLGGKKLRLAFGMIVYGATN
jgi:hypothetical protein